MRSANYLLEFAEMLYAALRTEINVYPFSPLLVGCEILDLSTLLDVALRLADVALV